MSESSEPDRAKEATDEEYALINPALELFTIKSPLTKGRHLSLSVDQNGLPVPGPHEPILERWRGSIGLLVDFDDESDTSHLVVAYAIQRGVCRVAITGERVVGTIHAGFAPKWGAIDLNGEHSADPTVLAFSWPLSEITNVNVRWEKRSFRGTRMTSAQVQASRPYSMMSFDDETPTQCDDGWRAAPRSAAQGDGFVTLAHAIVKAAAQFRLDRGIGDNTAFLEALVAGKRMTHDTLESAPLEEGQLISHMGILMPER